jgi:hypothetical protein
MEKENIVPVAEQVSQEEVNLVETEYTLSPDGSIVEATSTNQVALA